MKATQPTPAPLRTSCRVRFLVTLGALLLAWPAVAQPGPPPEASQGGAAPDPGSARTSWDKYDRARFTNESSSHYYNSTPRSAEPVYFFFPPVPPPLGSEIPLSSPLEHGAPAPPELAAYVPEPFYPMLGARLLAGDLPKNLRRQLERYRAEQLDLQSELRDRIAALKDADPSLRQRQLADLAAQQAPRLAALATAAEALRTDLRGKDLLGLPFYGEGWTAFAGVQPPGSATAASDPSAEARFWEAAAFYQDGLSPDQRLLLREAALERRAEPAADGPRSAGRGGPPLLYFSPFLARLRLPASLPPALDQKIRDYVAVKNSLKAELVAALRNRAAGGGAQTEVFTQLAAAQAPRLAALEALAEAIRRDLAACSLAPGPPSPPPLPPELTARIALYRGHKQEAIRVLHALLVADADTAAALRRRSGASLDNSPVEARDPVPSSPERAAKLQASVAAFDRKQSELVAALNTERAGIRAALSDYMRTTGGSTDRKSVNDLLKDFEDARQQQEVWARFRDYQVATLMPGLSPEQRRLLFSAAVEQLALPLPVAEVIR